MLRVGDSELRSSLAARLYYNTPLRSLAALRHLSRQKEQLLPSKECPRLFIRERKREAKGFYFLCFSLFLSEIFNGFLRTARPSLALRSPFARRSLAVRSPRSMRVAGGAFTSPLAITEPPPAAISSMASENNSMLARLYIPFYRHYVLPRQNFEFMKLSDVMHFFVLSSLLFLFFFNPLRSLSFNVRCLQF
jgi:hypothetical protein